MPRQLERRDYRYLNCDQWYAHEDHDTGELTGERSRGVFYGTYEELLASVAGQPDVVEHEIRQRTPGNQRHKSLIAVGTNLTRGEARRVCEERTGFMPPPGVTRRMARAVGLARWV